MRAWRTKNELENTGFRKQLTARELYLILRARSAVFVVEQSHVHLDTDGRDEPGVHVFAAEDMSRSMPVLAPMPASTRAMRKIRKWGGVDKIFTSPLRRGDGTAHTLIERVIAVAAERWLGRGVRLTAPVSLRGFYEAFGFRKTEKARFWSTGCRTSA